METCGKCENATADGCLLLVEGECLDNLEYFECPACGWVHQIDGVCTGCGVKPEYWG